MISFSVFACTIFAFCESMGKQIKIDFGLIKTMKFCTVQQNVLFFIIFLLLSAKQK